MRIGTSSLVLYDGSQNDRSCLTRNANACERAIYYHNFLTVWRHQEHLFARTRNLEHSPDQRTKRTLRWMTNE